MKKIRSKDSLDTVVTSVSKLSGSSFQDDKNKKRPTVLQQNIKVVLEESEATSQAIRKAEVKDFDLKNFQNEIKHTEVTNKNYEFR